MEAKRKQNEAAEPSKAVVLNLGSAFYQWIVIKILVGADVQYIMKQFLGLNNDDYSSLFQIEGKYKMQTHLFTIKLIDVNIKPIQLL